MSKNYYEILGLTPAASAEDIKKNFRKLALKFHPDKNPGDHSAEKKFKEMTAAYSVLSDPFKKNDYDRIHFPQKQVKKSTSRPTATAPSAKKATATGKNLIYQLHLTLEEAFSGCEKAISYVRTIHGVRKTSQISVVVPRGIRQDKKLRIRGAGESLSPNQTPGDLIVHIHVAPHRHYTLDGNDILLKVPLSFIDFLTGDPLHIPSLHGPVVAQKIHLDDFGVASVQIEKKGFPVSENSRSYGDFYVRFVVDVPPTLDENQKDKLRQVKKTLPVSPWQKEIDLLLEKRL